MTDEIIAKIEAARGEELQAEDLHSIKLWQRGRNLAAIPPHAWEELDEMFRDYVVSDGDACVSADPSDPKNVLAKQAIAHASAAFYKRLLEDRAQALQAASKTPYAIREFARTGSQVPAESLV